MRLSVLALGITCAPLLFAQHPAGRSTTDATSRDAALWLSRAGYLTAAIHDDSSRLDRVQRLLLPARLADVWAKASASRAREFAKEAVEGVTRDAQQESSGDRRARLEAASVMIPSLNKVDRELADRVILMLTKDAQEHTAATPSDDMTGDLADFTPDVARSLAESISDVARSDPGRAYELAQKSLQLHDGDDLTGIYQSLRDASPDLANRYLEQALDLARGDPSLLFGLGNLAEAESNTPRERRMPAATRDAILQAIRDTLLERTATPEKGQRNCWAAPAALEVLQQYVAADQAQLREAAAACKGLDANLDRGIEFQQRRLGEADREGNSPAALAKRVDQKIQSASLAAARNDLQGALDVMDSFTAEEREAAYPNWHLLWISFATRYIRAAGKAHDTVAIDRVLARAPDEVRARVLLSAASTAYSAKDTDFGNQLLGQAERELESNPRHEQIAPYLELLNLCAAHLPTDTLNSLRLAVAGVNNFKPQSSRTRASASFGELLQPVALDAGLLSTDYDTIMATVSSLNAPADRSAMRLGLLRLVLGRYLKAASAPKPAQRPARER